MIIFLSTRRVPRSKQTSYASDLTQALAEDTNILSAQRALCSE